MNKTALLVAALSMVAMLHPALCMAADTEKVNSIEMCASISSVAESIMRSRLNGTPMQTLVEKNTAKSSTNKVIAQMIIEAYDSPKYETEGRKLNEINEFKNKWYLDCYKALSKK